MAEADFSLSTLSLSGVYWSLYCPCSCSGLHHQQSLQPPVYWPGGAGTDLCFDGTHTHMHTNTSICLTKDLPLTYNIPFKQKLRCCFFFSNTADFLIGIRYNFSQGHNFQIFLNLQGNLVSPPRIKTCPRIPTQIIASYSWWFFFFILYLRIHV